MSLGFNRFNCPACRSATSYMLRYKAVKVQMEARQVSGTKAPNNYRSGVEEKEIGESKTSPS